MIKNLFAVCLLVKDFERSLGFYRDVLGLSVKSEEKGPFANFELEGTELAIFQRGAATAMFPQKYMGENGGVVVGFQVENLEVAVAEMEAKGVIFFEGPKTTSWGQKVAYFKDPDGNVWEMSEPFAE